RSTNTRRPSPRSAPRPGGAAKNSSPSARAPAPRSGRSIDTQVGEAARRVERSELLEAADRSPVDEDLRHGAPPAAARHHGGAQLGIAADVELVVGDAALLEQALGAHAVGAARRRVHLDPGHAPSMVMLRPAPRQARVDTRSGTPLASADARSACARGPRPAPRHRRAVARP